MGLLKPRGIIMHLKCVRRRSYCSIVTILCLLVLGCEDSDTTQAIYIGPALRSIYKFWVRDGRPEPPDFSRYVTSTTTSFFYYTNVVKFGTNTLHCRFAGKSANFRRNGILAITDEQLLVWIPKDDRGQIIVSLETNRWFDR